METPTAGGPDDTDGLLDALCERQRLDLFGELAGGLAHELNNALSVVSGHQQLLLEALEHGASPPGPDEVRTRMRTLDSWTGVALEGARRLYQFSRRLREPPGAVAANDLAAEAVELCRYRCERENVLLVADLCAEPTRVRVRPGEVVQLLVGLIQNAREALARAGDGGAVRLATARQGDAIHVELEDDGPGVPEAEVERIFQVGISAKGGPGVGLGLPVARRIAGRCGGRLWAVAGDGGHFILELPAAP